MYVIVATNFVSDCCSTLLFNILSETMTNMQISYCTGLMIDKTLEEYSFNKGSNSKTCIQSSGK